MEGSAGRLGRPGRQGCLSAAGRGELGGPWGAFPHKVLKVGGADGQPQAKGLEGTVTIGQGGEEAAGESLTLKGGPMS